MNKIKRVLIGLAATALAMTTLTACFGDKYTEPFKDGPRSGVVNREAADIIESPDGFSNVSTKCDHGNRLYVGYHGDNKYAAIAVVPADPTCR